MVRSRFPSAAVAAAALAAAAVCAQPTPTAQPGTDALRVCADPNNMPQSNNRGEGYENQIAQALARDLGRKLEYTYFPQRLGFVRNTLRARDETTQQFKCDLIMGVPKGYELTATTQPYMHSTYAMVVSPRADLSRLASAQDVLKLPAATRKALRIGFFAQTPAADWALTHDLMTHAVLYPAQSGDPAETVASVVARDLAAGHIDAAILWGPIAGYLVSHPQGATGLRVLPFAPEPGIKLDYEISMGLRQGEKAWQEQLDAWINAHHDEIAQILGSYHVPLLPVTPGR